jgi:hypothetical protein
MVIQSKKEPAEITITMVVMNGALGLMSLIAIVEMAIIVLEVIDVELLRVIQENI